MAKEITLQDIFNLIQAQNKRFDRIDKRFNQIDKRFAQIDKRFDHNDIRLDDLKRDTDGIWLELAKLNKLYKQLSDRELAIENDVKEIYDRLVVIEARVLT